MPKTILVVDDERHIVRLIQVNLERAGYTVVTAFDGREALEKVESEHPDLIVMDTMMPFMDGFEVLQTLRSNQNTCDIPVIMLLTFEQDVEVFKGWQTSIDAYLLKPFNPLELVNLTKRSFSRFCATLREARSLILCQPGCNTRLRRRSKCARPYPRRLIHFRRLLLPSTGPLLHDRDNPASTAA